MRNNNKNIILGVVLVICVMVAVLLLVLWPDKPATSQQNSQQNSQESQQDTTKDETESQKDTSTEPKDNNDDTQKPSENDKPSTDKPSTDKPSTDKPSTDKPSTDVNDASISGKIVALAIDQIGKAFVYADEGPDSFDVSGLIYYCFTENGINIPRTVKEQAAHGTDVAKDQLLPGDVVFFYNDTPGVAQYAGIYIGNGKFIAARSSYKDVNELNIGEYFSSHFVCAKRYW